MSKNRNRARLNKAHNSKEYNAVQILISNPPYSDDGIMYYPQWRKGFVNCNKRLQSFQMRAYKTWKHNRLHQWK